MVFDKETRRRLQVAYQEHLTDPRYERLREEARERGFRLAEVWEREHLRHESLFSWRGTVWVRIER